MEDIIAENKFDSESESERARQDVEKARAQKAAREQDAKKKTQPRPRDAPTTPANGQPQRQAQAGITIAEPQNAGELMEKEFPPVEWAIPGLLPAGLTVLGGAPKTGKSFFALQIAAAVACGGIALGKISVERGRALYLALEDTPRRIQERLLGFGVDRASLDGYLWYETRWPRQNMGGMESIYRWLDHGGAKLIVIDTLARFRPPSDTGGYSYEQDYAVMSTIKGCADDYSVAIMVIHHLRKMKDDDWLNELSGTSGITGAADTILTIRRERNEKEAILRRIGRDVEEKKFSLSSDELFGGWTLEEHTDEVKYSKVQKEILHVLRTAPEDGWTPKEVLTELAWNEDKYDYLKKTITRMAERRDVIKVSRGKYRAD